MKKILPSLLPYLLLSLLVVMWGSAFAALKVSLTSIPHLWVMSLRLMIGSLTIAIVFLLMKKLIIEITQNGKLQLNCKINFQICL